MYPKLRHAVVATLCILIASPGHAEITELSGKVKTLLLGAWVEIDYIFGITEDVLAVCDKPIISESDQLIPNVKNSIAEVPPWETAKGSISFFEHNDLIYFAARVDTQQRYRAWIYDYPQMLVEDQRAMISAVHLWDHYPTSGFFNTLSYDALETLPYSIAMDNGLLQTDQFLLQIGQSNNQLTALIATGITKNGEETSDTRHFFRCGDVAAILGE